MAGVYGRIDWYPYLHTWHVVGYTKGKTPKSIKEVTIGASPDKNVALQMLREWYQENKLFVRYT